MQAGFCFALWIAYGWTIWRRAHRLRDRFVRMSPGKRTTLSIVLIIGSALVMLLGLFAIQQREGIVEGRLTLWAWSGVLLIGLAFVHGQTMAGALMASLIEQSVTQPQRQSSRNQEPGNKQP